MNTGDKVGVVCCSNGMPQSYASKVSKLIDTLRQIGLNPVCSEYIYEDALQQNSTGRQRAAALMEFYQDKQIRAIFDISGGDIASEVLPYLDYKIIGDSEAKFWGYSDLTTMINAIYVKTGRVSILYQIRNLIRANAVKQISDFQRSVFEGESDLFNFHYRFIKGEAAEGIVVGGNLRCLLKLAGTQYWPDMTDKLLLLEANSTTGEQVIVYLNQLKHLGVFDLVRGIILGNFTQVERENNSRRVEEQLTNDTNNNLTIVKTEEIGHAPDSKAIMIGKKIKLLHN